MEMGERVSWQNMHDRSPSRMHHRDDDEVVDHARSSSLGSETTPVKSRRRVSGACSSLHEQRSRHIVTVRGQGWTSAWPAASHGLFHQSTAMVIIITMAEWKKRLARVEGRECVSRHRVSSPVNGRDTTSFEMTPCPVVPVSTVNHQFSSTGHDTPIFSIFIPPD